ncbi:glycosyltransferase family 39 protein [Sphaerospermopsis aphanizomenoides BCCUSP55]|uniref:glycosyltransferase family 39 protein n=1 Tax=Sphaerospermopsis aphanizomenoides TaxID=459663 RepID=UPI001904FE4F|nr:glycosyltransferase family 39 protein [Sphaerospermopsis aphanizomenoides]MBK1990694.1 glycosyltransferase family 39 protein [Sphaerospermopsis aphanizomenoides BCCUSP55]
MINRKLYLHYLGLTGAIALGAILRFWHLGLKPLWLDEIITAIFSLGKNYLDIPLDVVFPLHQLQEIFTLQPGVSCSQIAKNIANYSTHPPLFFCGMYSWLGWLQPLGTDWVEKLRLLPVLFGVAAIIGIYGVNSIAFSPTSGIIAALFMALSPFAVYLSQEARHYTLPMLLIILSLLLLIKIQQDIFTRQSAKFRFWLFWSIINSIGLYVHYFFILAFIAEIATLSLLIYHGREKIIKLTQICLYLIISTSGIIISFIPWILLISNHFTKSETNWLPSPHHIEPIYQTLVNWILMIITLPVENQPLLIQIVCILLMVVFAIWVGRQVLKSLKFLWLESTTHLSTFTLLSFTLFVLLQSFIIAYLLGKDITAVPRYSFVYYPGFCALLAASLEKVRTTKFIFLIVGMVSCILVVNNLTFQKPFLPDQVAKNMNLEPDVPLMLVIKYDNYQDVAAGLSFALALEKLRNQEIINKSYSLNTDSLAFVYKSTDLSSLSHKMTQLSQSEISQLNLWFVGSGMRKKDYSSQLEIAGQITCNIEPTQHYRIGQFPYQLYRCGNR